MPAIIDLLIILVSLLVPIFFLPLTSEFFEFNKLILIAVATIVMTLAWVVKMLKVKKVEVTRSPLDLPIGLFAATLLLATIFSLNKHASMFGGSGRWFPSLFGFAALVTFYYVATANLVNIKTVKSALSALLVGLSLSSLVALLGYFGLKIGSAAYFQIPNFTLTGSTTTAAIFAALACVLALNKLLTAQKENMKYAMVAVFVLNMAAVMLIGGAATWAVLGVGLLATVYFSKREVLIKNKVHLVAVFSATIIMVLLFILPATRNAFVNADYPRELKISPRESWIVTSSIIRDFPILGTGPSTFNLDYTRYKPLSVNNTAYWNTRFDKPFSEAFGVVGSLGIVGLIVTLALAARTVLFVLDTRKYENKETTPILSAGILAVMAALLFTYATVALSFVLVLLLVLLMTISKEESSSRVEPAQLKLASLSDLPTTSIATKTIKREREVFQYIIAVPLLGLVLAGGYYAGRTYAAEYFFRRAILAAQAGDGKLTYQMQQNTLRANAQRDTYQNAFATTNLVLAESLSAKGNLTDEEKATVQTLVAQAIRSSRVSTEILSPLNAANWETRAGIYRTLIGAAQDADKWSVRAYTAAIRLDPANPRLRIALGGVYYAAKDYLSAANMFTQATNLKPDYANAHYNLAQSLKQLERFDQAKVELEATQRLVAADSDDSKRVAAEIEEVTKRINVAGAQTATQPTVSELEGETQAPAAQQEPLTNAGEESTAPTTEATPAQ